ncbi:MAG TPA: phage tail tape measure protein [Chloroflexota bacterium]|jgi:TP901 family phage tail tape measure protein
MPGDQLTLNIAVTGGQAAQAQLDALDQKLKGMPQAAQQLGSSLAALSSTLRTQSPLWNTATEGVERMGAATTKAASGAATLAPAVEGAAASTATLERAVVSLGASLTPLPAQFNAVTSAAASVGGVTPALAAVTVGVGTLAAGLGVSVAAAAEFQQHMGALRAILPAQDVAQFDGALQALAQRLGRDTVFSATQAVEAMGNLARSGVATQDILGGVAAASLNMAAAMGGTPQEAALTLGAALREFNLPADQATHVADQFAAAVHVAGLNADEMRNGLARVAPVVNALGGTLDDAIMGMELLARSGLSASRSGTALAQIYEDVVNPRSKEAAALMQQLGITTDGGARSFVTAAGTVKPFAEIVQILAESLQNLTPAQQAAAEQTEFTRRAMQAAQVAVNAYANGGLDRLTASLHAARDAASAMQERLDNLPGRMQQLGSSAQTLAVNLGGDLSPALQAVVEKATAATNALIDLHAQAAQGLPAVQRGAATVVGPEVGAAAGAAATGAESAVQAAGLDLGHVLVDAMVVGIGGAPVLLGGSLVTGLQQIGAGPLTEEGKRIGADFVDNVAAAITAQAPQGADAFGAVAEQLIAEFKGRGFSDDQAREAATLYFDAVLQAVEARRPDMVEAGQQIGQAVAEGMDAARPAVIDASARIASEIGAALQANKGNVEAAIADVLGQESGPAAEQAIAQILQRGNALKAVTEALNTLTPAERAHYEALLLANGASDKANQALTVLNDMLAHGQITQEQYSSALDRGSVGLQRETAAHQSAARAATEHAKAVKDVADAIEHTTAAIQGFAGPSAEGFTSIGDAFGAGIQRGIDASADGIAQSAQDALQTVLDRSRGFLQISSPSQRAADQIGKPIAQGIAKGISEGSAEADKALNDLVGKLMDPLGVGNASYTTGRGGGLTGQGIGFNTTTGLAPLLNAASMQRLTEAAKANIQNGTAPSEGALANLINRVYAQQLVDQGQANLQQASQAKNYGPTAQMAQFVNPETGEREWQAWLQGADGAIVSMQKLQQAMYAVNDLTVDQANALDRHTSATDGNTRAVQGATAAYTAGTGAAQHSVTLYATLDEAMMNNTEAVAQRAAAATAEWAAVAANAQALQAGQMVNAGVAGGKTAVGLTTTQIYGNTATAGGQPTNIGPIPIVAPLTPGTLRGYASGAVVNTPTLLVTAATGRVAGLMAESGPEAITPIGASAPVSVNVSFPGVFIGTDAQSRQFGDLVAASVLGGLRRRGVRL